MKFPVISVQDAVPASIDTFGGYNHNLKIAENEFYDMKNMTSDYYPLLANRAKRKFIRFGNITLTNIHGMAAAADGSLYVIAQGSNMDSTEKRLCLYCRLPDGTIINYNKDKDSASQDFSFFFNRRYSIFMDAKWLYIFPEGYRLPLHPSASSIDKGKYYLNSVNMAFTYAFNDVDIAPCTREGDELEFNYIRSVKPEEAQADELWLDTSVTPFEWYHYDGYSWQNRGRTYTLVKGTPYIATGTPLEGDSYNITGTLLDEGEPQAINAKGKWINQFVIDLAIKRATTANISLQNKIPYLDFVIQCNNRLWGCRYSDEGEGLNEIYASALGKFGNWDDFSGIASDSYIASVGTPGAWTGAANVNGFPIFFKQDHYHKVYVSAAGAHQIIDKPCKGVQLEAGGSVAVVGTVCFYKTRGSVMAYDGSSFSDVGAALGSVPYVAADGGGVGNKYYLSLKNADGKWSNFVFDTAKGLWHKEDDTHAMFITAAGGDIYYAVEDENGVASIVCISDYVDAETESSPVEWEAITGLQGYEITGHKRISRFNIRMALPEDSKLDVFIEYNSSGVWEFAGHVEGTGTNSFVLPVRPKRCDHFRIKFSGIGDCRIYSFSKYYAGGSDK